MSSAGVTPAIVFWKVGMDLVGKFLVKPSKEQDVKSFKHVMIVCIFAKKLFT